MPKFPVIDQQFFERCIKLVTNGISREGRKTSPYPETSFERLLDEKTEEIWKRTKLEYDQLIEELCKADDLQGN